VPYFISSSRCRPRTASRGCSSGTAGDRSRWPSPGVPRTTRSTSGTPRRAGTWSRSPTRAWRRRSRRGSPAGRCGSRTGGCRGTCQPVGQRPRDHRCRLADEVTSVWAPRPAGPGRDPQRHSQVIGPIEAIGRQPCRRCTSVETSHPNGPAASGGSSVTRTIRFPSAGIEAAARRQAAGARRTARERERDKLGEVERRSPVGPGCGVGQRRRSGRTLGGPFKALRSNS